MEVQARLAFEDHIVPHSRTNSFCIRKMSTVLSNVVQEMTVVATPAFDAQDVVPLVFAPSGRRIAFVFLYVQVRRSPAIEQAECSA